MLERNLCTARLPVLGRRGSRRQRTKNYSDIRVKRNSCQSCADQLLPRFLLQIEYLTYGDSIETSLPAVCLGKVFSPTVICQRQNRAKVVEAAMAAGAGSIGWGQKLSFGTGHVLNDLCASVWFSYLLVYLQYVLLVSRLFHFQNSF